MPELPEVETIRRGLSPLLCGRRIDAVRVREPRLRVRADQKALKRRLAGRRVLAVRRRAKYLLVDVEGDSVLMIHLGMSGRLRIAQTEDPLATHDHVVFTLDAGGQLRFNDARRFGLVAAFASKQEAKHRLLTHLGPEPLDPTLTSLDLWTASRKRKVSIKTFLMDSRRIVGVGNIYASEALHRAAVRPTTPVQRVSRQRWEAVLCAVRETLSEAIDSGGTTLRDFTDAQGNAGYFAQALRVYGREGEPCPRCSATLRRQTQAGRSTFYCAHCQR